MKNTKSDSNQLKPQTTKKEQKRGTQHMDSLNSNDLQTKEKPQSPSLSMSVAEHLLFLMKEVTKSEVDPKTVNAACNCASQMINLMKMNLKLRDI